MARARGRVDDDWIERRAWRRFGPPTRAVEYDHDAHRLLGPLVGPPRVGGYEVPVHVSLVSQGGEVRVEVAGYRIGRLNAPTATQAAGLVAGAEGRATVCGLVVGGDTDRPQLEVRLWLDRRLSRAHDVALAHQREAIT